MWAQEKQTDCPPLKTISSNKNVDHMAESGCAVMVMHFNKPNRVCGEEITHFSLYTQGWDIQGEDNFKYSTNNSNALPSGAEALMQTVYHQIN